MSGTIVIVDASAFAFRAFYSFAPAYRESDGQPIGAVLGFMSLLWKMMGAAQADPYTHAVAVFDAPGQNFRHHLFPEYKANRAPARSEELRDQMPFMRHAAEAMGMVPVEHPGFEADDVIATIVGMAKRAGIRSTIVSSDKDFGQLVELGKVEIVDPMAQKRIVEGDVIQRWGVEPGLVPHVQALCGDAADGIPGIAGCGPVTAARLIRRWGDLEGVLNHAEQVRFPRVRLELKRKVGSQTGKDRARLFLKLTTLNCHVPLTVTLDDLKATPPIKSHVQRMLRVLEAPKRFQSLFGLDLSLDRAVEPEGDAGAALIDLWRWWKEELAAPGQPIPDEPQVGFYKRRLVKGGPWVAARIYRAKDEQGVEVMRCELGDRRVDPRSEWFRLAMHPIEQKEFAWMKADAKHALNFRPNDPKATPGKAIDLRAVPVSTNPRKKI